MPRKVAFSGKQKKKQLQEKRLRKQGLGQSYGGDEIPVGRDGRPKIVINKINEQPVPDRTKDPNRFKLHFFKENDEDLRRKRQQCTNPIVYLLEKDLESDLDDIYKPGTVLDIPRRPEWKSQMSKQNFEQKEVQYFQGYLDEIFAIYGSNELSYFEMNLETWRQLWRVCEMSDILLLVADIRHPALHFSPALYRHVTEVIQKPMILVLNKIDLAPLGLVVAWKDYFQKHFPKLHILYFTSFAAATAVAENKTSLTKNRPKSNTLICVGAQALHEACEDIVKGKVNMSSWKHKIDQQLGLLDDDDEDEEMGASASAVITGPIEIDDNHGHIRYRDGVLTIGCVGHPNVGKSSMINSLNGKKVVSVSKSPGHTKHFQTIFITPTVRLCDCPGLIFPSLIDKSQQVLSGLYPIAQVREPYSCIAFLAARIDIPAILKIVNPRSESSHWTSMDIALAWALKCGYMTSKGARPDTHRAANHILRLTVEGRIRLGFTPPEYTDNKESWRIHKEVLDLVQQGQVVAGGGVNRDIQRSESESESESDDESCEEEVEGQSEGAQCTSRDNPFSLLAGD